MPQDRPVYLRRNLFGCQMFHEGCPVVHQEWEEHRAGVIREFRENRSDCGIFRQVCKKIFVILPPLFRRLLQWIMSDGIEGGLIPLLHIKNTPEHKFCFPEGISTFLIQAFVTGLFIFLSCFQSMVPDC